MSAASVSLTFTVAVTEGLTEQQVILSMQLSTHKGQRSSGNRVCQTDSLALRQSSLGLKTSTWQARQRTSVIPIWEATVRGLHIGGQWILHIARLHLKSKTREHRTLLSKKKITKESVLDAHL